MMLKGVPVSKGIAIGPVFKFRAVAIAAEMATTDEPEVELERFRTALMIAKQQILEIHENTKKELGEEHAEIFQAHLLMLEDPKSKNPSNDPF
jgi:phosphotransferase system enzyme I (PtsI)